MKVRICDFCLAGNIIKLSTHSIRMKTKIVEADVDLCTEHFKIAKQFEVKKEKIKGK